MKTIYIIAFILLTCSLTVMAQGGPPATPIDGGISLLLAVGGAYGAKKLLDKKKY